MSVLDEAVESVQAPKLTKQDRCDRCGAEAKARATFANGYELLFCAHHAREYSKELIKQSTDLDLRGMLNG